eukprot:2937839-Pyramimonas_sp.AAC.1
MRPPRPPRVHSGTPFYASRDPIGSFTEGPSGRVRMRPLRPPQAHLGTPSTRVVAPEGAPPKAPAAASAC